MDSRFKKMYISNKMECFSYKGGCGVNRSYVAHSKLERLGVQINGFWLLAIFNSYTWARVVCLIYTPEAQGPQVQGPQVQGLRVFAHGITTM